MILKVVIMKTKIIKIKTIAIVILFLFLLTSQYAYSDIIDPEDVDEKFAKFLLTESEMKGYTLEKTETHLWEVGGEGKKQDCIIRKWVPDGSEVFIKITLCVFDSAPEAISGTRYYFHVGPNFVFT